MSSRPEGPTHCLVRLLCRPFRPGVVFGGGVPVADATGNSCVGPSGLHGLGGGLRHRQFLCLPFGPAGIDVGGLDRVTCAH